MLFTRRFVPVTQEFSVDEKAPPAVAYPAEIESPSAPIDVGADPPPDAAATVHTVAPSATTTVARTRRIGYTPSIQTTRYSSPGLRRFGRDVRPAIS